MVGRVKHLRLLLIIAVCVVGAFNLLLILAGLFVGGRVSSKSGAWHSPASPQPITSAPAEPLPQLESHTCGLLSLSAAYKAYGLSPGGKNLRFRLGVDRAANPVDSTSTGTLHPDLLRVIAQDGFTYAMLDPARDDAPGALTSHLESSQVALLLIRREETGGLHWVLTDESEGGVLRIVDSLKPEPVREAAEPFLRRRVLSIILMRPAEAGAAVDIGAAHRAGMAEMLLVRERMKRLGA